MIELKTKLRRWGNSFGIIIPQKSILNHKFKEGDEITLILNERKSNVLRETFGTLKAKKSISKFMKEMDKELYND